MASKPSTTARPAKLASAILAGLALVGIAAFATAVYRLPPGSVLIQSEESRTLSGGPVFNRIRKISRPGQEIWMMQQSHEGIDAPAERWERLAIVVEGASGSGDRPAQARFYQLEPGPLEWPVAGQPLPRAREFRVSCFFCHSNGPRAIRPERGSTAAPLALMDRVRVAAWNWGIRRQGRVAVDATHDRLDPGLRVPFRSQGVLENDALRVQACARCHGASDGRSPLLRQQAITIDFMVRNGYMPPDGRALSVSDRRAIRAFIRGL
jgi:mono/diheme cytochrome c family protein